MNADRIELLKPLQLPRLRCSLERSEGGKRHKAAVGSGDMNALELIRGEAFASFDLRDHFVASPLDAESIHEIPAQKSGEVAPRLTHIRALRTKLVAIENELRLGLVEFQVRGGEHEQAPRKRLRH